MDDLTDRVTRLAESAENSPEFERAARDSVGNFDEAHSLHSKISESLRKIDEEVSLIKTMVKDRILDVSEHYGIEPKPDSMAHRYLLHSPRLKNLSEKTVVLLTKDILSS